MTIGISKGWAQYDWSLGTFRAEVDGEILGNYTEEIPTLDVFEQLLLERGVELTDGDRADLIAEYEIARQINPEVVVEHEYGGTD